MKISIIIVVISFLLSACGGGGPKYGYNHSHSDFNRFMQDRYMCIKETRFTALRWQYSYNRRT